jgi:Zn finger protein HypA/HybF involved in hydrogenase expression
MEERSSLDLDNVCPVCSQKLTEVITEKPITCPNCKAQVREENELLIGELTLD